MTAFKASEKEILKDMMKKSSKNSLKTFTTHTNTIQIHNKDKKDVVNGKCKRCENVFDIQAKLSSNNTKVRKPSLCRICNKTVKTLRMHISKLHRKSHERLFNHQCFGGRLLKAAELNCCSDCIQSLRETNSERYDEKNSKNSLKTFF